MTAELRARILAWCQARVCGPPGESEFDSLSARADGDRRFVIRYTFDHDGFSQYDKTVGYEGWIEVDGDGVIVRGELTQTHQGVAAP